jgi:8-oxo-dGTP pyrophosphatase MutT (NUDIX family)
MAKTELNDKILRVNVGACCLIAKDDRFLCVQEKTPDIYGLWTLPAGKVEKGQTIRDTAMREASEETGYDVEIVKELGLFHKEGEHTLKHVFVANIIGGESNVPNNEIMDMKWLSEDEVIELNKAGKVRNDWVLSAIRDYKSQNKGAK